MYLDHTQHLHPHRHGVYTHPQPPPIYHHGIPTTELSQQQHLHCKYYSNDILILLITY